MRQLLGILLIALPFVALLIGVIHQEGPRVALQLLLVLAVVASAIAVFLGWLILVYWAFTGCWYTCG